MIFVSVFRIGKKLIKVILMKKKKIISKLTNETFTALLHTTTALVSMCKYIFMKFNLKYILLGKFQTDPLEARFGQFQVLESETRLKLVNLLSLSYMNSKIREN